MASAVLGGDEVILAAPPDEVAAVLEGLEENGLVRAHHVEHGAVTADVLRSLMVSQHVLGTREVLLIQHTSCGMLDLDEEGLKAQVEQETGTAPGFPLEAFSDLEENLLFVLDERGHTVHLTDQGVDFMSPSDHEAFVSSAAACATRAGVCCPTSTTTHRARSSPTIR